MSHKRGWQALHLEMPDRIPQTEYIDHQEFIAKVTGIDPGDPRRRGEAFRRLYSILDYDVAWCTHERPITGRVTDMGHAEWNDMSPLDRKIQCPFRTEEEVLAFDPVEEYGMPEVPALAQEFQRFWSGSQAENPGLVFPGGRYNTLFSACIRSFGWEMFLAAAGQDYERFDRVLEGFFQLSLVEIEAWVRTDIGVFICHDDMVWTSGAIFHPDWYRKCVFPRYKKLWEPLRQNGITVLFCSDGNFTEFVDDLAEAGADGFIFEPLTSLEYIVERYGRTKVIVGNVDCRTLIFGTEMEIRAEVKRCMELGRGCPGYFIAVGNHIPPGVPIKNVELYFDLVRELGAR